MLFPTFVHTLIYSSLFLQAGRNLVPSFVSRCRLSCGLPLRSWAAGVAVCFLVLVLDSVGVCSLGLIRGLSSARCNSGIWILATQRLQLCVLGYIRSCCWHRLSDWFYSLSFALVKFLVFTRLCSSLVKALSSPWNSKTTFCFPSLTFYHWTSVESDIYGSLPSGGTWKLSATKTHSCEGRSNCRMATSNAYFSL